MSLIDDLKNTADKAIHNPTVQNAVNKGKEFISTEKGKQTIEEAKDKAEEFVREKTKGKGILGFGKAE